MAKYKVWLYEDVVFDHLTPSGGYAYKPTGKRQLIKVIEVNSYYEAQHKAKQIAKELGVRTKQIVLERVRRIKLAR